MLHKLKRYELSIYLFLLIFFSLAHFIFGLRTGNYFSVDDFAVLAYLRDNTLFNMVSNFLVNGDIFGFRKVTGYIVFGSLFKLFGVNSLAFDLTSFVIHTVNLILLFTITRKITKNNFSSFFISLIFNSQYLFYYSNIHEYVVALFSLLTIYIFIEFPKKIHLYITTFVLALLSKETAVTVPLVLYAISFFHKVDRKKILILLILSILTGIYIAYFFVKDKVINPNFSYQTSFSIQDVVTGLVFYLRYKYLILVGLLVVFTRKVNIIPLFLVVVITLLPASILVNRRELYYLYLPFAYLVICLGYLLPRLNLKTLFVYMAIFIYLGGRLLLPKIAWQTFPNWQKESLKNVLNRINERQSEIEVYVGDLAIERDARLMLESGTTDLFLEKELEERNNFVYKPDSAKIYRVSK